MAKELEKKASNVMLNIVFPVIVGFGFGAAISGPVYNIDGNEVRRYYFPLIFNKYVQKKGEDKVKYISNAFDNRLKRVVIDGDRYKSKDTLVYPVAKEEWISLKEKIKASNRIERESKKQEKLKRKEEKVKKDLEILRR